MHLDQTLMSLATTASDGIPGADGVGLTLYGADGIDRMLATVPFVSAVDKVQYAFGQGPCLTAASELRTIVSAEMSADPRWTLFGTRARRLGVRSALSLPLQAPAGLLATLNVYAHSGNAFGPEAVIIGEQFASGAAITVQHALVTNAARELSQKLQDALAASAVINRAIGLLMVEDELDDGAAIALLQQIAADTSMTVEEAATALVDQKPRMHNRC